LDLVTTQNEASRPQALSVRVHLLLMTGAIILLAGAVFTVVSYTRQRQALLAGIDETLVACTQVAKAVPPEAYFDRILHGDNPVTEEEFLAIVDRNNKLCLELDLQYLWSCMVVGTNIVFTTATSPGKDVTRNDHAPFLDVHRDPAAFDVVFSTMQPDFSSFQNEWGHGRMVLVPYSDSHGRAYCVGASISVDDVRAQVMRAMWKSLGIGCGIMVISLLAAGAMSTALSRPIVSLTRVADSIARGDMEKRIDERGALEIRMLARSLGSMRDAIQRSIQELRQHRDHLEDLVQERTAELERSNRELEQFAYVASHDLREPLRKVKSFADLFARKYNDKVDEQGREYINYMVDGALRMQHLIEALLAYSRVGRAQEPPEPVDLAGLVETVLASIESMIKDAGAEVTVSKLPTVRVNARLTELVFQNLILNAMKFRGNEPPRVDINAEKRDNEWVISVQDNGIGIDRQHFERIFQIFQRLHGRGAYEGTGIGLALCKKIVEEYGGRIWVESTPGEGSTFYFTLSDTAGATNSEESR